MTRIIVIGSKGQLGNEFQAIARNFPGSEFFFYDKDELDIQVKEDVGIKLAELKPQFLINCAAYTAVDKAETDKEIAFTINSEAVGFMAAACRLNNTRFIHISTDYVFDGTASSPYKEDDDTNPTSVYGETKLEGEREALRNDPEAIIIRTAWVYSAY
ncbi:MAG TPA: NAD(P)-dependent oxidoreductase, partial [Chitinophagaceae bacterium]|nr:NAD(P)-dependent oxidoreductase [Chitinophagaceae bacterium]